MDKLVQVAKQGIVRDEILYDIADFFKVLGDSTRLKILFALKNTEFNVGELSQILGMNQSAVSHQLRILRQNDLVKFRKQGKTIYYALDDDHIDSLLTISTEHIVYGKGYENEFTTNA